MSVEPFRCRLVWRMGVHVRVAGGRDALWMGDDCRYGCPDVLGYADDNLFGFCPAKTFYVEQNKFSPVLGPG